MREVTWPLVVAGVNESLGATFTLVRPLSGGRQGGAWVVSGTEGQCAVLTWSLNPGLARRREETITLVHQLVDVGYPTPAWVETGTLGTDLSYVIAQLAPGRHVTWAELPVEKVLAAIELQAGLAQPTQSTWSDYALTVLTDPDGPRGAVAALGTAGEEFLALVDAHLPDLGQTHLPVTDAVHGDMEVGNILVDDNRDIAIIDIDACGPGTRALDYAWLLRDAWTHRAKPCTIARIYEHGESVAGSDVFKACIAVACLELVAFVAHHAPPAECLGQMRRLGHMITRLDSST